MLNCRYPNGPDYAIRLYQHAAEQGETSVLFDLAALMLKRRAHDDEAVLQAVNYLEAAVDTGDTRAIKKLAVMYEYGADGVAR
jgi:TPR repeat protein